MTPTILLVEDNDDNRTLMSYLLQARCHHPLIAESGAEGIRMAIEGRPDLILMDVQMPEIDGLEALAAIRRVEALADTPVIAVTAIAMVGDRERLLAAGFSGYMRKPISPETFVDEVEERLAGGKPGATFLGAPSS